MKNKIASTFAIVLSIILVVFFYIHDQTIIKSDLEFNKYKNTIDSLQKDIDELDMIREKLLDSLQITDSLVTELNTTVEQSRQKVKVIHKKVVEMRPSFVYEKLVKLIPIKTEAVYKFDSLQIKSFYEDKLKVKALEDLIIQSDSLHTIKDTKIALQTKINNSQAISLVKSKSMIKAERSRADSFEDAYNSSQKRLKKWKIGSTAVAAILLISTLL